MRRLAAFVVVAVPTACAPAEGIDPTCPSPDTAACTCPPPTTAPTPLPSDADVADLPPFVVASTPVYLDFDVDPALTFLEVTFSKDMGSGYAWLTRPGVSPALGAAEWVDARTNRVEVTLAPATTYTVQLNGGAYYRFTDVDGDGAMPFTLVFRTAEGGR